MESTLSYQVIAIIVWSKSKLYDKEIKPYLKPNVNLMKNLLPELSYRGDVTTLSYPYKSGSHRPRSFVQVKKLLEQIQALHKLGYVHGDIRIENLLYSYDGEEAYILDFDFANPQDTQYPVQFNHDIEERNVRARAGQLMKKHHDRFSLYYCFMKQYGFFSRSEKSALIGLLSAKASVQHVVILNCSSWS